MSRRSERLKQKRTFIAEYVNTESDEFTKAIAEQDKPITKRKGKKRKQQPTIVEQDKHVTRKPQQEEARDNKRQDNRSAPIPLDQIQIGDIMSQTHYFKVTAKGPQYNQFQYLTLRGAKEDDPWTVTTPYPFQGVSASNVTETIECTKTQLAQKLMECKDEVFTVTFKPILTQKRLKESLNQLSNEELISVDRTTLAKRLMDCEQQTIRGRLVKANTELGYSLVDKLEGQKNQEIQFRNVNHRDIVELIHRNVRYVLKRK